MQPLIKRLKYLRSREAMAAALLPIVLVWKWWSNGDDIAWVLRLAALCLVVLILAQGTLYWHFKLQSIEDKLPFPPYFQRLFQAFKWSNFIGMGAILAALLLLAEGAVTEADIGWSVGLLVAAMLEQVNYYHYQLMYDTPESLRHLWRQGQLRKAALANDMTRDA